ncbi:MAG: class I SAM-dependent methyltransferase [Tepidisphaeraceae bacterium]
MPASTQLKLLPQSFYIGVNRDDPIRFYHLPLLGRMYRRRVELCLDECRGGQRVLEIGFGSGMTFLNLNEKYREIHGLDLTADVNAVASAYRARGVESSLFNGDIVSMPFPDQHFDTVLLISILEHLKADQLAQAMAEVRRVLKPGGQMVYGVPVERRLMAFMFRVLGFDIREHHFSSEQDVAAAATTQMQRVRLVDMQATPSLFGSVYQVGHFTRPEAPTSPSAPSAHTAVPAASERNDLHR